MICQYIKDNRGRRRGMIVAEKSFITGEITIGWSLCNKKDKFNKKRAHFIALGRALNSKNVYSERGIYLNIPKIIVDEIIQNKFLDRTRRYFKIEVNKTVNIVTLLKNTKHEL
jgi:hypothetical protein